MLLWYELWAQNCICWHVRKGGISVDSTARKGSKSKASGLVGQNRYIHIVRTRLNKAAVVAFKKQGFSSCTAKPSGVLAIFLVHV